MARNAIVVYEERTPSHVFMCPRHLRDGYELESFFNSS